MSVNDEVTQCPRCKGPMPEVATRVVIESGPLRAAHPTLDLCSSCSESLGRWVARRGKRSRSRSRSSRGHEPEHEHGHRSEAWENGGDDEEGDAMVRNVLVLSVVFAAGLLTTFVAMSLLRR